MINKQTSVTMNTRVRRLRGKPPLYPRTKAVRCTDCVAPTTTLAKIRLGNDMKISQEQERLYNEWKWNHNDHDILTSFPKTTNSGLSENPFYTVVCTTCGGWKMHHYMGYLSLVDEYEPWKEEEMKESEDLPVEDLESVGSTVIVSPVSPVDVDFDDVREQVMWVEHNLNFE